MKYVDVKRIGDVVVVRPKGSGGILRGDAETDRLRNVLLELHEQGERRIVLSLCYLKWTTTPGLSVMIQAHNELKKSGGRMVLSNLSDQIDSIVIVMKLCKVFEIYPTEREAVASFGRPDENVGKEQAHARG